MCMTSFYDIIEGKEVCKIAPPPISQFYQPIVLIDCDWSGKVT